MRSERSFFGPQKAGRLSGASLLALVFVAGSTPGSEAQERFFLRDPQFQRPQERLHQARRQDPRGRPTRQPVGPPAHQGKHAVKSEKAAPPPAGPHLLIVSVKSQRVSFYANGKLASQSPVSTGMPSHPTPHGVFSIIQRNRHHRSNIYSGAPMPYMQRLTWSGVALHQGVLPGRPASHGCIRLPEQYASYLWGTIKMNTRVIVSREDVEPFELAHARLFQPKPSAATVQSLPELRKTFDTTTPVRVHTAGVAAIFTDASGARADGEDAKPAEAAAPDLAASKPAMRDLTTSVESLNTREDAKTEIASPLMPTQPELAGQEQAREDSTPAERPDATASIYPQQADIPEPILSSFVQSLEAKRKKTPPSGTISVFISKKDKRLYVRQHFIPLFSAPVSFKDDKPHFGTHVFTALAKDGSDNELRWIAVTLPPELPKAEKVKTRVEFDRRGRPIEVPVKQVKAAEPISGLSANAALDRIEIAPEVVDRISEYVTAGASMIVSEHGLGYETGLYTDFIVVTR